jgi:hypothetical protein
LHVINNFREFKNLSTPYLRTTLTNRKEVHDEIRRLINLEMLVTIEFKKIPLLSKTLKLKIHKTIILLVLFYGCEMLFLISNKEHKLNLL